MTRRLVDSGFSVHERALDDAAVDTLRAAILAAHREVGSPPCFADPPVAVTPTVERSQTGIVFRDLLTRVPGCADHLFPPSVADQIREALGEDAVLEVAAGVASDTSRPFFAWHNHIGGTDDWKHRRAGRFPERSRIERLVCLHYLDALDAGTGRLLVHPRAVGSPTAPPHAELARPWPDQIAVEVPRGTVVVTDECLWHAAEPMTTSGLRMFVGAYVRRADVPPPEWTDASLAEVPGGSPGFRAFVRRAGA